MCSCNGKHTHSSEFMIPTRMSTCPISCLESSPTLSHMLVPCMKIVSKQKYLFYLWATLRYKYVGQSFEVNLLDNSPKQFMGLSEVNCWTISQNNSSDNFLIKFSFSNPQIFIHLWTYSDNQLCDAPFPRGPLTTRQPAEIYKSHVMRTIHVQKWPLGPTHYTHKMYILYKNDLFTIVFNYNLYKNGSLAQNLKKKRNKIRPVWPFLRL